ncbi:hypothetical protein GH714_015536 [Hevea brasiliensis]|uniref:Terpene synthase N-terminal domain-containing protein n=1 Tax=Hevea brasiliensis TaxID=3981 RepID=A0A6A6KRY4_HEVBR|nr:hypothetical protein GH714_015536 [Hevea brasiliensis]
MSLPAATQRAQVRRTAQFHPTVWGDYFIKRVSDNQAALFVGESDVFSKFKDGKGNFKEDLINDVHGLLSLYEASYLSVQGEDILDEALEFTKTHLIMATQFGSSLADQVSHALRWPIRRGLPRKESRDYFSIYQQDEAHIKPLLKLAKLDYNIVQMLHQKDMNMITKFGLHNQTTFRSRQSDRMLFLALGTFSEPQYVFAREVLSKAVAMLSVMDDIYDVHGTIEELELFTKVLRGLARLIDDIRSHEFEQERGHVASAVECYMKQHGVSQQEAYDELYKIVINLWKDLNEELLKETADIPKPILMCILNIVRVMDVVYKDEDSYTNSKTSLKDILATFLVHPVPV